MTDGLSSDQRLDGWKSIAYHLGVSVRTAQTFERELGLPVHRPPGPKGRVWANAGELDEWADRQRDFAGGARLSNGTEEQDESADEDATEGIDPTSSSEPPILVSVPAHSEGKLKRSVLVVLAAVVLVTLASAVGIVYATTHRRGEPSGFRIDGHLVTVTDEGNRILWRQPVPDMFEPKSGPEASSEWPHAFVQLENGHRVLAIKGERDLHCFDGSGRELWRHSTGQVFHSAQGVRIPENYSIRVVASLPRPRANGGQIVVGASRGPGALFAVELLDPRNGKVVSRYLHFGWFFAVKTGTLGDDGHELVFVAGVDDASSMKSNYGATLVVLDPDQPWGQATTQLNDPRAGILEVPPAQETAVLLIKEFEPSSDPSDYCHVTVINLGRDFLELLVTQGRGAYSAWFRFNRSLQLETIIPDRRLIAAFQDTLLKNVPPAKWQATVMASMGDLKYIRNKFADEKHSTP